MRITGTYEQLDGQPVVRFERTFPHPVEAVWAAVTDPTALEQWFPTTVEFTELRPGEPIAFRFAEVVGGRPPRRPASGERWRAYYEEYKRLGLSATAPLPE